ncbi:hypothetical protein ACF8PD_15845 [Vibrio plantisponsor]|uniref:hypothetical protein n=1 Tax=Vibrio plantisponsor TaxID=664643 RepID=UPI00370A98A8
MDNKGIYVILGMHRSGTSAISRALKVFDIELGCNLMPAYQDVNDKGFWEDMDIYRLNEEMLSHIGQSWDCLSEISDNDIDLLIKSGYMDKAKQLLSMKLSETKNGKFGFKDPRVTKLFGFWSKVLNSLNCNVYYILVTRHPYSIAQSLKKREHMLREKSLHLWLEYMKTIFRYLQHDDIQRLVFANYEHLLEQPMDLIDKISNKFSIEVNEDELKLYTEEFLSKDLQHHEIKGNSDEKCIAKHIDDYFKLIVSGEKEFINLLSSSEKYKDFEYMYPLFEAEDRDIKDITQKINELESLNEEVKKSLISLEADKYTISSQFEATKDKLEVTVNQLEVTTDQLEVTTDQLEVTTDQLEVTTDQLEVTTDQLESTINQLDKTTIQLEAFRASRTYKVMTILSKLKRILTLQ